MLGHLTIKEARNEITKLENELDLYLTKKKINFEKTQPGSPKMNDILTSKTGMIFDKFTHYIIKDSEYDSKIYSLQESINAYQKYVIEEMKRISENGGSELIVYYRDELKLKWEEIVKLTHYSLRQCHNLYNQAKK
ncbi:MAG: hypothetical protein IJB83_02635 [Bacilli bacterium]|nr:hypothetical protein [Bacilli bacterium]